MEEISSEEIVEASSFEAENQEAEMSDDEVVKLFLDELKLYRKKISSKTKSSQIKKQKPFEYRKKREKHKLFDPHPPKKTEEEKTPTKTKIITANEKKSMLNRLTKKKEPTAVPEPQTNSKRISDQKIIDSLYNPSIEAAKKKDRVQEEHKKEEEEKIKNWTTPKTCRASKVFAHNKMVKYVNDVFGNSVESNEVEFISKLVKLGLIGYTKKLAYDEKIMKNLFEDIPELEFRFKEWNTKKDSSGMQVYTTSEFHKLYLQVANGQITSKMHSKLKERLLTVMANEKKPAKLDFDPLKQFTTAKTLSTETLDRLVKIPQRNTSPKNLQPALSENEKEEKSFILSKKSQEILSQSNNNLSSLPIDQRERQLEKRKSEKIEKMRKEFQDQLIKGKISSNPLPEYDKDVTDMWALYKEKKKNYVEEKPTYRPTLTKYENFLKMQEAVNSNDFKPNGWDNDVNRHRKGYADFIHLKRLKTEGINYVLQCRLEARLNSRSPSPKKKNEMHGNETNAEPKNEEEIVNEVPNVVIEDKDDYNDERIKDINKSEEEDTYGHMENNYNSNSPASQEDEYDKSS